MKQYKPRDKITQKMTREGAVEVNAATGKSRRISKRIKDAEFTKPAEQPAALPPEPEAPPQPVTRQAAQEPQPQEQAAADMAAQYSPLSSGNPTLPHAPDMPIKADTALAERAAEHLDAAYTRKSSKKAARKAQAEATAHTQSSRLQFTDEELSTPELQHYIDKSNRAADRLDEARAAIPKKKQLVKERTFKEAAGKGKTRLRFEETDSPQNGKLKHNPLSRPVQEAGLFVHNKVHSVEKDNSGVEGAHKSEEVAERAAKYGTTKLKQGYRSHKLKPYRAAAKAEKAAVKANTEYLYQKTLHDNPQLAASNPFSRYMQKQRIKKQYAKTVKAQGVKAAKTAADNTRKAAKKTAEATEQTAAFAVRHWKGLAIAAVFLLLLIMLMSGLSSCSAMFSGALSSVAGTSYVSDDTDMLGAEADYAALEEALQREIDNIERTHSGYDEYRYDLDEIKHDPYVLTSILTALNPGYTRGEVQSTLQTLFEKQYTLTLTEEVEIRYRTVTHTDPETGETSEDEEPYEYYILNVKLENFDLSHVPVYIMTEEQLSMYAVYMKTLGNRPDLFPNGTYPNASTLNPPLIYDVPPEALEDATFAAMLKEAEKYLGYPYVWGGASPSTSFDCSGFVSWVINHSGWNVGRLTANGLLNICTPVSSSNAQPGDLIFFQGTYNTSGASHVGIYVGNGMMIHCGNPISYANINTNYWQSHFYTFGRLP